MESNTFFDKGKEIDRRDFLTLTSAAAGTILLGNPLSLFALEKKRISIATGGMGGVYFVIGGGIASILTKYAGVEAAAEVTAASVDNCKLLGAKKSDIAMVIADTGYDAYKGSGNFKLPIPLRTLCVLYPHMNHIVTIDGKGIKKVADLKGKRVSTGAPGSGTEVIAFRILEAAGISHEKDIKKDRLGASESSGALKDGKIDAYFWSGGVPTSSVLDIAASPGVNIYLIPHDDLVGKMTAKYGPIYYKSVIPKKIYTGIEVDTPVSAVSNLLMCHQDMDEQLAYDVVNTIFGHLKELVAIHKEAQNIIMKDNGSNKFVPFHKGAQKFFKEKGINVFA
ncbi:MAG: TAXI family TRAP transporter solute-binding subunit [Deltaproteobacteria bacterium]|nr:TAXI family TRAP transporter solute-binding subunit [Deltaproteobacteria bacterium]